VTETEEAMIRKEVYKAINEIIKISNVGMAEIDWLFFSGRKF
jgi:hypothetical protein